MSEYIINQKMLYKLRSQVDINEMLKIINKIKTFIINILISL